MVIIFCFFLRRHRRFLLSREIFRRLLVGPDAVAVKEQAYRRLKKSSTRHVSDSFACTVWPLAGLCVSSPEQDIRDFCFIRKLVMRRRTKGRASKHPVAVLSQHHNKHTKATPQPNNQTKEHVDEYFSTMWRHLARDCNCTVDSAAAQGEECPRQVELTKRHSVNVFAKIVLWLLLLSSTTNVQWFFRHISQDPGALSSRLCHPIFGFIFHFLQLVQFRNEGCLHYSHAGYSPDDPLLGAHQDGLQC